MTDQYLVLQIDHVDWIRFVLSILLYDSLRSNLCRCVNSFRPLRESSKKQEIQGEENRLAKQRTRVKKEEAYCLAYLLSAKSLGRKVSRKRSTSATACHSSTADWNGIWDEDTTSKILWFLLILNPSFLIVGVRDWTSVNKGQIRGGFWKPRTMTGPMNNRAILLCSFVSFASRYHRQPRWLNVTDIWEVLDRTQYSV